MNGVAGDERYDGRRCRDRAHHCRRLAVRYAHYVHRRLRNDQPRSQM